MNEEKKLDIQTSLGLSAWLKSNQVSLAFTTYQIGKIFMIGVNEDNTVHTIERTFPRCMGIALQDDTIWMSSIFQMWRFENSLAKGQKFQGYDKIYIPQLAYTTGDLDIHDIIVGENGKPIFVNTRFNCLATISDTHSFKPLWKPSFISQLTAEDRCHLNGLAGINGIPKYVTVVGISDVKDGWREHFNEGGVVIDVATGEVVCRGLSMPHSPRVYKGKLWLLNAGTGYFGYVDINRKSFVPVTFCPGFLRGLSFINEYAIVGMSKNRNIKPFENLLLENELKAKGMEPQCGLKIININTGEIVEWVKIEGIVKELYDILAIPNVAKPMVIGTYKEDVHRMISIEK